MFLEIQHLLDHKAKSSRSMLFNTLMSFVPSFLLSLPDVSKDPVVSVNSIQFSFLLKIHEIYCSMLCTFQSQAFRCFDN